MSVTNLNSTSELSAARELRTPMQGRVVVRGDDDYARRRQIWNRAVEHQPALLAVCDTPADVQAPVRVARRHSMPFSVRGGGHHFAGPALCPEGLVIDLSTMRQVTVDRHSRGATVQGGARLKVVAAAAGDHGLVAAPGNCGAVGMAGLTLGGGYGPLNGPYSLAADNLLGAEVALSDGRLVKVGPDEEPDLFWAIWGGGGNFGVVTTKRVQLHKARHMLAGPIVFPLSEAEQVLRRYAEIAATMRDELGINVGMTSSQDGKPMLLFLPLWELGLLKVS